MWEELKRGLGLGKKLTIAEILEANRPRRSHSGGRPFAQKHSRTSETIDGAEDKTRKLRDLVTARPDEPVFNVLKTMREQDISQIPVYEDAMPIGTIYEDQILNLVLQGKDLHKLAVREVMKEPIPAVQKTSTVERVVDGLSHQGLPSTAVQGADAEFATALAEVLEPALAERRSVDEILAANFGPLDGSTAEGAECLKADEVLAYIDSEEALPPKRLEHLRSCSWCSTLVASARPVDDEFRQVVARVKETLVEPTADPKLKENALAAVARALPHPQPARVAVPVRARIAWLMKPAVLAGAAALVLLTIATRTYLQRFGTIFNPHLQSVAVLPIQDLSGGTRGKYLAYGMTEGLITYLGSVKSVNVIGSRSVMQAQRLNEEPTEIARKLNVDAVVEASMRQEGDQLVLSARLIRASTKQNLWSRTFERDLDEAFELQNDVVRNLASVTRAKLSPDDKARFTTATVVPSHVLSLYMEGRYLLSTRDKEDMKAGLAVFQKIVEGEPKFALGWASLADSYSLLALHGFMPSRQAYQKARESANKAIALDPKLADAHAALGLSDLYSEWNWAEAEKEFREALTLNPSYADAHHWYGNLLSALKRYEEAIHELKRAVELEPLFPPFSTDLGNGYFVARHYDLALEQYEKTLAGHPKDPGARQNLSSVYVEMGKCPEAVKILKDLEGAAGDLAFAYAHCNQEAEARKLLRELENPFEIGLVYAALGERDPAFEWLRKACEQRSYLLFQIAVDPALDSLRRDPRYQELLRCIHYPKNL